PASLALHSFPTRRSSDLAGRCWADRSAEDRRLRKAEAVGSNPTRSTPATRSSPSQRRSRPTPKPFRIVSERGNSYVGSLEMTTRSEEHTSELQSRGHLVC